MRAAQPSWLARLVALLCAGVVAVPAPLAAQVVSAPVRGGVGIQAVPAPLGSPALAPMAASLAAPRLTPTLPGASSLLPAAAPALRAQASISPALAADAAAPLAAVAAQAAAPTAARAAAFQPVSQRQGIRSAVNAVTGDEQAGREKPGLARLGADAEAPRADASPTESRAQAESFFNFKAGGYTPAYAGIEDAHPDDMAESAAAAAARAKGGSGKGRGKKGKPEKPADPKIPARTLTFNGKEFPSVAFRPDRPVAPLIVDAINAAKTSIDIAVYEFKNRDILKALRDAKARGVKIRVIVDFYNAFPTKRDDSSYWPSRSLELQSMIDEGFEVTILRGIQKYGIAHNKLAVFDGKFALFGSYNWSNTSEENHFENLVFTDEKARIAGMQAYWDWMKTLSVPFKDALAHPWARTVPAPPKDAAPSIHFNGETLPAFAYSPDASTQDLVIRALNAAKESIDVSMFTLTAPRVTQALVAAKKRGVKVRVLADRSQYPQEFMKPFVDFLAFNGIPVKTLAGPNPEGPEWAEKDHNKLAILDGKLVLTGSTNWTMSAFTTNFDGLYFLDDAKDAASFQTYFDAMFKSRLAERVVPPPSEPELPTEETVLAGLEGDPKPMPQAPQWGPLPEPRQIQFNGETLPSAAVRPVHPIQQLLVKAIDASQKSIDLAVYEFNLDDILAALKRAKARGVKVRVVIDYNKAFPKGRYHDGEERQRNPTVQALFDEFDTTVLRGTRLPGIMHNKLAIFDGKLIEFGSYNWSFTAENHHFENIKFEDDPKRVAFYQKYWDFLRTYSKPEKEAEDWDWARNKPAGAPVDEDLAVTINGTRLPRQAFSPAGMIEDDVVKAIQAAKTSIEIAMFSFYSVRVAEELLAAKNRGVQVSLVLDRMQSKLMKLDDWFAYHDFDVRIIAGPNPYDNVYFEKNHNKFMLVDGQLLETGSYNYTGNAETHSYENVSFTNEAVDIAFYRAFFKMLYDHGWKPMKPKRPPEGLPEPERFFSSERFEALGASAR